MRTQNSAGALVRRTALLLGLLAVFLSAGTTFAASNLIKNGKASAGLKYWKQASGAWEVTQKEVDPCSGDYFAAGNCEKGELYQDISLKNISAGTVLALSTKCRDYDGSDICILKMSFRSRQGKTLSSVQTEYRSGSWKTVKTTGIVPDGASSVRVSLAATRNAGNYNDAYFDNVSLTKGSLYSANLLNNGSGEYGVSAWTDPDGIWGNSISTTSHNPKDGTAFLWPCRSGSEGSKIYQTVPVSKELAGKWVTLSGWLANYDQAPHDQAVLTLTFLNSSGKTISSFSQSQRNPAWQKHIITRKIPSNAAKIRVTLSGKRFVGSDLDCYFDDVRLTIQNKTYKSITLKWKNTKSIKVGSNRTLAAKYGSVTSASSFKWSSSYDEIATVNQKGVVTFKSPGTVTIYATHKSTNVTGSITFTVKDKK